MTDIDRTGSSRKRVDIRVDSELLAKAQTLAGTSTTQDTVHYALEELVRRGSRRSVLELRGAVAWDGELEETRVTRTVMGVDSPTD